MYMHAHRPPQVHTVHYSVGLAGRYRLHVGLRQQRVPLPGSPFRLEVLPGGAYAASTRIASTSRALHGVADEEMQFGLLLTICDMLGNRCTTGGAKVTMELERSCELHVHGMCMACAWHVHGMCTCTWRPWSSRGAVSAAAGREHARTSQHALRARPA